MGKTIPSLYSFEVELHHQSIVVFTSLFLVIVNFAVEGELGTVMEPDHNDFSTDYDQVSRFIKRTEF